MVNLEELCKAVIKGDAEAAAKLTRQAISADIPVDKILKEGLIPGLQQVGKFFERGEYYLPELVV
jgi:methanogenic corrinoid protein MtbC1